MVSVATNLKNKIDTNDRFLTAAHAWRHPPSPYLRTLHKRKPILSIQVNLQREEKRSEVKENRCL